MNASPPPFRRYLAPLLIGIAGTAVLVTLGSWQLQRLSWKQDMLARIEARIEAPAVALPARPDADRDQYLAVEIEGESSGPEVRVLVSRRETGPGYRILTRFDTTDGRAILLDRGFVPERQRDAARAPAQGRITGNLLWPNEVDQGFTPEPDRARNIWFARDLGALAAELGTAPLLVVQSGPEGVASAPRPWPVDTASIPDNHLQYAVTWFSLAVFWMGMTLYWLWRIRRRTA